MLHENVVSSLNPLPYLLRRRLRRTFHRTLSLGSYLRTISGVQTALEIAPVIESHNQVISRQLLNTLQTDQTIKSHVEPCRWSLAPKRYLTFGYLLKINQVHSGVDEAILVMANIHIFPSDAHWGDPLGVATLRTILPAECHPLNDTL